MKKRLIALLLPAILGLVLAVIPNIIYHGVDEYSYVSPAITAYQPSLTYTGEVFSSEIKEVYLEAPVIPSEVLVHPGDTVTKGTVIAYINTDLTKKVLEQGTVITPGGSAGLTQQELYEQYGKAYGLSEDQIAEVFNSQTAPVGGALPAESVFIPSTVTAPMDGVITQVNLSSDVLSSAGTAAFVISSPNSSRVKLNIPQTEIDDVYYGAKAYISGQGMGGSRYTGLICKIYPTAKKEYNNLSAEVVVETDIIIIDGDENIKDGYQVEVVILTSEEKEFLSLPYEAVRQDEKNREYVWVIKKGRAYQKFIETGMEMPDSVEIIAGIERNDRVILNPGQLTQGQLIRIK